MKKNVFLLTLFVGVFSIYPNQNQLGEAIVESPIENSFTGNDTLRGKMIENLSFILEKINDKKYEEAASYFLFNKSTSKEVIEAQLQKFIDINEISADGISILAENGLFGRVFEIFPERAEQWLSRSGLEDDSDCYAFRFKNAEVAGKWNGEHFVLFRLDDVGKLPFEDEQ